ncbi:SdpI family protein [Saccharomonospora viridis]|uniref:SdpI family protein n=1 Tax=Saccharomonospora viridis (strain ATCC 15386 / DSM 43017 / JCM 3036 / CCUG 5913 / NBRC 12207 / NCIMB 9602 / P101) TaxID=471857 RepID=C7MPP6_SACVD|nr:SdpI family protein [Saccharomonospora viridis]ACU96291.1 hypothetical protein Svir_12420 [Saccharomonospora viridis DSM 43017]
MESSIQLGQRLVGVGTGPTIELVIPLALVAVVMGFLGILGRKGKIKPNGAFGIRTTRTMNDSSEWYRVHREAAPWSLAAQQRPWAGCRRLTRTRGTPQIVAVLVTMATMAALLTVGTVSASRRGGSDQN